MISVDKKDLDGIEECGNTPSWLVFRYCTGIFWEELKKNTPQ
jgi:hypothetical protein